ncbi:MAG TPA: hypothetical protein VGE05_11340 [Novosphingobium sp.]
MLTIGIAVSGLALAGGDPGAAPPRTVIVAQPVVMLGDLVDLASIPIPLRARAVRIEIGATSPGSAPRLVTRRSIIRRIRAQLPFLGGWAEAYIVRDYTVLYRAQAAEARNEDCLRALRDIAENEVVRSEDFTAAQCGKTVSSGTFRYIAAERTVRARRRIAASSVVPLFAGYGVTAAYAGDTLTLLASNGPVTVTRQMRAMQSVRRRERVLVQSDDGQVLSVPYAGTAR